MNDRRLRNRGNVLSQFATAVTRWTGSTPGFIIALLITLIWAASGPFYHWSDTWQLVINTGTTVATFLMVFLIQRSQNKDSLAIQLKLDELVAAMEGASNRLIAVEDLSEEDLRVLRIHFQRLADMAQHEQHITESHSIEEAEARHHFKKDRRKKKSA